MTRGTFPMPAERDQTKREVENFGHIQNFQLGGGGGGVTAGRIFS